MASTTTLKAVKKRKRCMTLLGGVAKCAGLNYSSRRRPMAQTLFQKVWDAHTVRKLPSGQTQLFVGLHLVHEVTTPQAFDMLRQHGWKVAYPERTFGTVDHIVPTSS